MAAMEINAHQGDEVRKVLRENVAFFVNELKKYDLPFLNQMSHPVVYVPVGTTKDLIVVAKDMLARGVVSGFRVYPLVRRDQSGMRFSVTGLHTREDLRYTVKTLHECMRAARLLENKIA